MKATPFAWNEAIGFGIGILPLSSDEFWRMTPRELALAVEAVMGRKPVPLARTTLIDLMARFPDGGGNPGRR